jgi:hypothetical protein
MYLIFDLDKGRFGMRSPPLFDATQDLFTLCNQACLSIASSILSSSFKMDVSRV